MASRPASRQEEPAAIARLGRIGAALRRLERFELGGYRPAYVERRLAARLAATGETMDSYAARLERDADERRLLVEALGVNVTAFFRDPEVWLFLEEVALPPLVGERAEAGGPLRALSLGCAGGQEAYSAAMLLAELLEGRLDRFRVDAWDMDGAALEAAREAWYPRAALQNLAAPALARYFDEEGEGYRVAKPLRARVHVARRDMLVEGVAGAFDLVLLRNVIIYFGREARERLLRQVHASLAPRGLLVLGQSETMVGETAGLFRPLSLRNRVYARVEPS